MSVEYLVGDVRDVLPTLDDQSVQCVVTSPPYFGLRDYGTAEWEGGDAGCDHSQGRPGRKRADPADGLMENGMGRNRDGVGAMGGDCRKCGARRIDRQIGLESSVEAYVAEMVAVFREVRRVLRDDGVLFLNLGDSYAANRPYQVKDNKHTEVGNYMPMRVPSGLKPKDLIGVPWRVAFALQNDGWYLRSEIIWAKPNPMPESVRDRPTKAHETIFLLTKSPRYFWDREGSKEPAVEPSRQRYDRIGGANGHTVRHSKGYMIGASATRNMRSVWTIPTAPFPGAHFATFPPALVEKALNAATPEKGACPACGSPWVRAQERAKGGPLPVEWFPTCSCNAGDPVPCVVLDPFAGAGTVSLVAERLGRDSIYIDLNPEYADMARERIEGKKVAGLLVGQARHGRRHAGFNARYFGTESEAA